MLPSSCGHDTYGIEADWPHLQVPQVCYALPMRPSLIRLSTNSRAMPIGRPHRSAQASTNMIDQGLLHGPTLILSRLTSVTTIALPRPSIQANVIAPDWTKTIGMSFQQQHQHFHHSSSHLHGYNLFGIEENQK